MHSIPAIFYSEIQTTKARVCWRRFSLADCLRKEKPQSLVILKTGDVEGRI